MGTVLNMSRLSKLPDSDKQHRAVLSVALPLSKPVARPFLKPLVQSLALAACFAAASAGAAGLAGSKAARAGEPAAGDLVLRAKAGETLIEVAERELAPPHDWRSLARLNGIRQPTVMPVGRAILVPAAWRKPFAMKATVVSVEGPVKSGSSELKAGSLLSESDSVQTGANAVVVVKLPDGTVVRIPPASQVRIDRLRGYHGSEAINARINLDQGGIEVQSESSKLGRSPVLGREVQVVTPKATASVRGTSFRIVSSADGAQAEVLDGSVQWSARDEGRTLTGGLGAAVDAQGRLGKNESLLPGPAALVSDSKLEEVDAEIEFKAVAGADKYLVEVARDKDFSRLLSIATQSANKALVRSDRDGPLYMKVRPVSVSGLAGFDAKFALNVAARPVYPKISASEPAGVIFGKQSSMSWNVVKEAERYRIQIASDADFANVVSDELTAAPSFKFALNAPVSDITPYFWRVASLDKLKQGPWAAGKKIEFAPVMGAVSPKLGDDAVKFEWTGKADQTFEAQLSEDASFGKLLNSATVKGVSWNVSSLSPGQYQMRVRQVFSNGLKGPYSPALQFELPRLLLDGSGRPVRGGAGDAIRSMN